MDLEDTLVRDVGTLVEFAQTEIDFDKNHKHSKHNHKESNVSQNGSFRSPTRTSSTSVPGSTGRAYVVRGDSSPSFEPPLSPHLGVKAYPPDNIRVHKHASEAQKQAHISTTKNLFISQTMVTVCSSMYCLILMAVGIGFALAYLVMHKSSSFNINIYHSYHLYLYSVGIVIQLICLSKKLCDTCDSFYNRQSEEMTPMFSAFGTIAFRVISGVFGILTCIWFLIEFSWRVDVIRQTGNFCSHRNIHIAVLALAVIYTLLHVFVTFYNAQLLVVGYELFVLIGLMHMVGTNISTWAWTAAHFSLTTLKLIGNETAIDVCETSSPIGSLVVLSQPYFSPFVAVFNLWAAALLLSLFLHYATHGTFFSGAGLEGIVKRSSHHWAWDANLLGLIALLFLLAGTVVLIVYHYLLIDWMESVTAQIMLEIVCLGLQCLSMLLCMVLLFVHHNNSDNLNRETTLESIVLLIASFGLFLWDIGKATSALRLESIAVNQWTAATSIVEIGEVLLQSSLLLSALKYYAKFLGAPTFRLQQSATLYLVFYNFAMTTFMFMRQKDQLYGKIYIESFGSWMWVTWKYFLPAFPIVYRLFSAVCFLSLWKRSYKSS